MTQLIGSEAPQPDDDANAGSAHQEEPGAQRRTRRDGRDRRASIPSAEECLAALNQLTGAVALGLVKPAQAATIRANYAEILKYHRSQGQAATGPVVADADVLELLRQDRRLLEIMEPFLTDAQLDLIMKHD